MIEEIIDAVLGRVPPSSYENMSGFVMDAEYALDAQDLIASVELETTGDPRSMLNGTITFRDSAPTLQAISKTFATAWPQIAYADFQAYSIVWYLEATVLRFVTAVPDRGLCVTGTLVARSSRYAQLVEQFHRDFGDIHPKLQPYINPNAR